MTKRKPLSKENQEYLEDLLSEYKEKRDLQYQFNEDSKELAKEIVSIFKNHGIEKKVYKEKQFYMCNYVHYNIPRDILMRARNNKRTQKIDRSYLKMLDVTRNSIMLQERKDKFRRLK